MFPRGEGPAPPDPRPAPGAYTHNGMAHGQHEWEVRAQGAGATSGGRRGAPSPLGLVGERGSPSWWLSWEGWATPPLTGPLDGLYPQGLWRYFRPVPGPASGSILYRHVDGYLLLAPVADLGQAQRLSPEAPEIVRDAVFLSEGKAVAYIATDRRRAT